MWGRAAGTVAQGEDIEMETEEGGSEGVRRAGGGWFTVGDSGAAGGGPVGAGGRGGRARCSELRLGGGSATVRDGAGGIGAAGSRPCGHRRPPRCGERAEIPARQRGYKYILAWCSFTALCYLNSKNLYFALSLCFTT